MADDDDWLSGYLASTEYGSNSRINSKPVKRPSKKKEDSKNSAETERKVYQLQAAGKEPPPRRKSWSAPETPKSRLSMGSASIVPVGEALPDRVNAIRDATDGTKQQAGHFVREHRNARERAEHSEVSPRIGGPGNSRRRSVDYDELEAVKQRVSHAATLWVQNKSSPQAQAEILQMLEASDHITFHGDILPSPRQTMIFLQDQAINQTLTSDQKITSQQTLSPMPSPLRPSISKQSPASPARQKKSSLASKPSSSGKGWLLGKWLSRLTA